MSYLTSGFITLSKLIPIRPKIDKELKSGGSVSSIKNTNESFFYNLNHFKQEGLQEQGKATKTPPLVLFINLLMKDGKKTHALRVLSMTLSLFKARISKIKLQKHFSSLKKKQSFYQYFYNPEGTPLQCNPWGMSFSKKTIANCKIKSSTLFVLFSKKSEEKKVSSFLLNVAFSWYLNYRKTFPFIFNFEKLFYNFYEKKRFFCGKFLELKQYPLIKQNKEQSTLHLLGHLQKRKSILLKQNKESQHKALDYIAKKSNGERKSFGENTGRALTCVVPTGQVEKGQGAYGIASQPFSFQIKEIDNSKNCLWYKTLAKKPSWSKLTSAQKNTFLFCLYKAISNVKPPLECRTKRIGGSNKQIPSQVSDHRQWGIAIRWIIEVAQNEFSKKKNKINLYKPVNRSVLNNISKASGNIPDKLKFPRGFALLTKDTLQIKQAQSSSWVLQEKTKFLSSFKQSKAGATSLKVQSKKTRFYSFCFFLAESLENAYYKTGPAMQKRNLWVETALANRAFLRYRWW